MRWKLAYILSLLWVMLCAPAQLWSLTTTSTYNTDNSLATLATPAVATLTYGYDANGNRTGETYSNVPANVINKTSRSLDYDAQDRLTKQELADGNKQTWTLSAVGNWTQTQLNQDPAQTRTHTATHQIASMAGTALSYDAKGNMTTDQRGYVYRWDHENRLIEVLGPPVVESATTQPDANSTPGSTTQPEDPYTDPDEVSTPTSQPTTQPSYAWRQTYTYDAMGRRVSRTTYQNEVASTTYYVSAGMQEVAEYTDSSDAAAPTRTYVYGSYVDEPVQVRVYASATTQPASTQNATKQPSFTDYYYHTNALYSVIAVTDTAGTVLERYTYDAYGQRTITDAAGTPRGESIMGNEIGFTGRRLDPLTNQYYFRARYYDAAQGRFISRDPLEYVDGMSLYGGYYVPNGLDPEGKFGLWREQRVLLDTASREVDNVALWKSILYAKIGALGDYVLHTECPDEDEVIRRANDIQKGYQDFAQSLNAASEKTTQLNNTFMGGVVGGTDLAGRIAGIGWVIPGLKMTPEHDRGAALARNLADATNKAAGDWDKIYYTARSAEIAGDVAGIALGVTQVAKVITKEGVSFACKQIAKGYLIGQVTNAGMEYTMDFVAEKTGIDPHYLRVGVTVASSLLSAGFCFTEDTPVWTEHGVVPIAEVRAGDSVWGVSAETGGWVLSKVLGVSARNYDGPMVAVTIRNSRGQEETLHATGGHPFWIQADPVASATRFWKQFASSGGANADAPGWVLPTPQGLWVAAEQLQLGDQLLDRQDGPATITGLRITRERQRVYNLTVLRIHNYAVGEFGVLVHNGCNKTKPTGSYTNTHASGKTYSGKGSQARAAVSGKQVAKLNNNDSVVHTDWQPAPNNRAAFKDEARRIADNGGARSPNNYNKINSPGAKYIVQDGD